jgi:phosphoribosylformimino-5-aminoimidazole carboxamide ribotide isomerase
MQVIPVIDLLGGQVVRGIGGRRNEYRPIQSRLASDSQPAAIAKQLKERFGFDTVYVADLDAITGGDRRRNIPALEAISDAELRLWLDAGSGDHRSVWEVIEIAGSRAVLADIVVGLETLKRPNNGHLIAEIKKYMSAIFSLDLKSGVPITQVAEWQHFTAMDIAQVMHAAGVDDMIVLDLEDVGCGAGTRTLDLCRQMRQSLPGIRLTAGGGVRGRDDLAALADAGCDAVLVASALHDGRLTASDIQWISQYQAKPLQD